MKNILKYSDKYLTVEVIQGIKIFQIRYACVGGESNPGLPRGSENSTTERRTHFNDRLVLTRVYFLISRCNRRIVSVVKI